MSSTAWRRQRAPGVVGASAPQLIVYAGDGIAVPQLFLATTFSAPRVASLVVTSVSTAASSLTIEGNNGRLTRAESVSFSSTGALPAPLIAGVRYVIATKSGGVTLTLANATTLEPITLLTSGSGSITATLWTSDQGAPPLLVRTLDSGAPSWAQMHTASGVYDWTLMDEYLAYHYAQRGRRLLFTFNQTPPWAASNSAPDAYGVAGGGQSPTNLTIGATFITALLTRAHANGAKPFMGVELWNEPSGAGVGVSGQNWVDTNAKLAEFGRYVYQAVKAFDPSLLVLSPGFTTGWMRSELGASAQSMANWLTASDGASGRGRDWIDGVCYHGYDTSDTDLVQLPSKIDIYRKRIQACGLSANFPLYQTERGSDATNHPLHLLRCAAIEAALGVQMSALYTWDFYGTYPRDTPVLASAIARFYSGVCGKTLTYCAVNQDGSVTVTAGGVTQTF